MPLSKQQKEEMVAGYRDGLAAAETVFLVGYEGITVPEATELRSKVRDSGGSYIVVKNRLVLRAIEDGALAGLREHFSGPTAVVYGDDDPVALAKAVTAFAKEVPAVRFKAGVVEGKAVGGDEIEAIATLPGRDELVVKLVFLLQSPISRLVRTLAALPRGLVMALAQVREQKEQD